MKRIAFAAAAALLGTGCISSTTTSNPPPPSGSVDIGWTFLRYRLTDQQWLTYGCAQADIDNVVFSSSTGQSISVPCSDNLGDGATIRGVLVGTQNVVLIGRRGVAELYESDAFPITVVENQVTQVAAPVQVLGIPGNIAVYANFLGQFGDDMAWLYCSDVIVSSLSFELRDSAEEVIASGTVSCSDPAGVSFVGTGALDLDNYAIRMKAYRSATQIFDSATMALVPSCTRPAFNHFVNGDSWDVPLYDITNNGTPPTNYGFCP